MNWSDKVYLNSLDAAIVSKIRNEQAFISHPCLEYRKEQAIYKPLYIFLVLPSNCKYKQQILRSLMTDQSLAQLLEQKRVFIHDLVILQTGPKIEYVWKHEVNLRANCAIWHARASWIAHCNRKYWGRRIWTRKAYWWPLSYSVDWLIEEYWQLRILSICTLLIGCKAHQAFRMCCKYGCWVHLIVSDFIWWYIFWFITTSVAHIPDLSPSPI